ncbi:hypothetical protein BDZ97DRAFT_1802108 [Flammula alnicola]|nr:hypothetical protein BDZ97DRAFT_1802108 [Flammula alnicola]
MSDWNRLVYKLSDLLQGPLTSIEILPGGLKEWECIELPPSSPKPHPDFPFVLVEGNLGIPKKVLYALYTAVAAMPWQSSGSQAANAASSIILLLNPAHQTALNTRKRLIQGGHLDPEMELILTELVSRGSPECAKQSIVWDHRRWCFKQIYGIIGLDIATPSLQHWASSEEMQLLPKINPAAIEHELGLIQHTCETYPRNYHSWTHWHFMVNVCYASIYMSDDRRAFLGIIVKERTRLQNWVNHHVSDYSAMHQLCQSQKLIEHLALTGMLTSDLTNLTSSLLAEHSLSLVTAFPSHESLWMYLRVSLANLSPENRTNILDRMKVQDLSSPNIV